MMNWYEKDRRDLLAEFKSNEETGINSSSVPERQQTFGKNQFEEQEGEGILVKILHNLRDVSTCILLFAAVLSLIMGIHGGEGYLEFVVIMGIVVLNMILAITQERSAEKA
ncbi:MAG: cation-transporting P-type ATPase, partial [Synergistaceae bacterium]|nr:cation-transporting P-type ATPase [Synergistaceae bacterium]